MDIGSQLPSLDEGGRGLRWDALFADLEGQLAAEEADELAAELADRIREEQGRLLLFDRLLAAGGLPLDVVVRGHGSYRGRVSGAGIDWLALETPAGRGVLIPLTAVQRLAGLPQRGSADGGAVAARYDLRSCLRRLAIGRLELNLLFLDGGSMRGRITLVGADHVDVTTAGDAGPPRTWAVSLSTLAVVLLPT